MKTKCCHTRYIHVVDKRKICVNPQCENYLGTASCYLELDKAKKAFAIGLFTFSILFSFDDFSKSGILSESELMISNKVPVVPLTLENLKNEILLNEIICADEVFAQIKLESGNLNSSLLKKTNNMLGMRYPAKRKTKACGIYLPEQDTIINGTQQELRKLSAKNNYAVYTTWQDAVSDYKLWQESNFKMTERYLEFLGNIYAEDSMYVSKIRTMTASIEEN